MDSTAPSLDLDDIQGIVLFAYASLAKAAYVHVSFPDSARSRPNAWLAKLANDVAAANVRTGKVGDKVNVALTAPGLLRFGVSQQELETFPRELQQGMGHELRAHVLGDIGDNRPETWQVGGPHNRPVHALQLLYSHDSDSIAGLREREAARAADFGGEIVHIDEAYLQDREHFGFTDGIEQPHIAGSPRTKPDHFVEVPAGEFILGYPNAYSEMPPSPRGSDGFDVGKNGTYLVYRKLQQDVAAFWQSMLAQTACGSDPIACAARVVGRWPSGAPLVHYPHRDIADDEEFERAFEFTKRDPDGLRCPLGAHVRRANPRDMLLPDPDASLKAVQRHRLVRRGRSYGPPSPESIRDRAQSDGRERGLVFVVLNASIRRQFEFVQQTWINNPKFAGLYDERDPLVATVHNNVAQMTIPGHPVRSKLNGLPRFVTTRGGGYYFVPGLRALHWLAARRPT